MLNKNTKKSKKGFTLTEVLVVVLIIGVISAIAYPVYTKSINKSRAVEAINLLEMVRNKQIANFARKGEYLPTFKDMGQLTSNAEAEVKTEGDAILTVNGKYELAMNNATNCMSASYVPAKGKSATFTFSSSYEDAGLGCDGDVCKTFGNIVGSSSSVCNCGTKTCSSPYVQNAKTCACDCPLACSDGGCHDKNPARTETKRCGYNNMGTQTRTCPESCASQCSEPWGPCVGDKKPCPSTCAEGQKRTTYNFYEDGPCCQAACSAPKIWDSHLKRCACSYEITSTPPNAPTDTATPTTPPTSTVAPQTPTPAAALGAWLRAAAAVPGPTTTAPPPPTTTTTTAPPPPTTTTAPPTTTTSPGGTTTTAPPTTTTPGGTTTTTAPPTTTNPDGSTTTAQPTPPPTTTPGDPITTPPPTSTPGGSVTTAPWAMPISTQCNNETCECVKVCTHQDYKPNAAQDSCVCNKTCDAGMALTPGSCSCKCAGLKQWDSATSSCKCPHLIGPTSTTLPPTSTPGPTTTGSTTSTPTVEYKKQCDDETCECTNVCNNSLKEFVEGYCKCKEPCDGEQDPNTCECYNTTCTANKTWNSTLKQCVCPPASTTPNRTQDENCNMICDRTDCPKGYWINTDDCKCYTSFKQWRSIDSQTVRGKVVYDCYFSSFGNFDDLSGSCDRAALVSVRDGGPNGDSAFSSYSDCPKTIFNYGNFSNCSSAGEKCRYDAEKKDTETGTPGLPNVTGSPTEQWQQYCNNPGGNQCGTFRGVTLTCDGFRCSRIDKNDGLSSYYSGVSRGNSVDISVSVSLYECREVPSYDGIYPWETPTTTAPGGSTTTPAPTTTTTTPY